MTGDPDRMAGSEPTPAEAPRPPRRPGPETAWPPFAPAAFDEALGRLRAALEPACAAPGGWPERAAAAIRAALEFAAAEPAAAHTLTTGALAGGEEGRARYRSLLARLGAGLRAGRAADALAAGLPAATEEALLGGLALLVAERVDSGAAAALPAMAPEAAEFLLRFYLGAEGAARVARAPRP